MTKKKKVTGGNPANRARKDGTGFEDAVMEWAKMFVLHGDNGQAKAAAAVATWVGASDPGRTGINQCVNACYQLQMVLDAVGVTSVLLPVTLKLLNPTSNKVLGSAGTTTPGWSDGYRFWSGHAVLYLPSQGRILDPTIGQAIPAGRASARIPLIGKVTEIIRGTPDQATQPGTRWAVARDGHVGEYQVLKPEYSPLVNEEVVKALQSSTSGLRDRLPRIVQATNAMLTARDNLPGF